MNHGIMTQILKKQGFHPTVCAFFEDYLIDRQTQFFFNGCLMDPTDFTVGVGQGSALSPTLSGLYIAPILHKWAPIHDRQFGNVGLQFFVDDGLISVAGPPPPKTSPYTQLQVNNSIIAHIFHDLARDMNRMGLGIEVDKLELMHFTQPTRSKCKSLEPDLVIELDSTLVRVTPKTKMRYLGFFLDPALTFRDHVKFYATKACSTVASFRMLGNSVRGFSPVNKRRLYIANVLSLMTYGAQLWWHPSWKGKIWAAKALQQAQNRAARWITGCFRTTPIGAMEMAAGLIPIRHQINRYMQRAALRVRTVHDGHPTRASLPEYWTTSVRNICAPFPLAAGEQRTPLVHIDWIARQSDEDFDPLNAECRPGSWLIDEYHTHIKFYLEAPNKSDKSAFNNWTKSTFLPGLKAAECDPTARILFTDGSASEVPKPATGAAWAIYDQRDRVDHGHFGYGKATPYDTEMAALARGIRAATSNTPALMRTLHIYVDNKAAAEQIFKCPTGPAQMLSIMACRAARGFLERHPNHTIHVHWCPAHVGIAQNEFVDSLAKRALKLDQPPHISLARAKQDCDNRALAAWRANMNSAVYRGKHNALPPSEHRHITHQAKTHLLLKAYGADGAQFARAARLLTAHFPHGAFRQRFNLAERTDCWCGGGVETRHHILFDCPLWIRKPDWEHAPPEGNSTALPFDDLKWFLLMNPLVATFEWYDILDKAEGHTHDDDGRDRAYFQVLAHMHTRARRDAWVANTLRGRGDADETFTVKWDAERRARAEVQREEGRSTSSRPAVVAPPTERHGEG